MCNTIFIISSLLVLVSPEIFSDDTIEFEGRIVGGLPASVGQFPHQVSLRTTSNWHFCGGCIINKRWIVSAAHCVTSRTPKTTRISVGSLKRTGGTLYDVAQIQKHPNYTSTIIENDISLLQTTKDILFNANVAPIPLSMTFVDGSIECVASGWGQTSHPGSPAAFLQYVLVNTITTIDCRRRHSSLLGKMIHDSSICTFKSKGKGMCMGDSGGPLVCNGELAGLVSWGVPCARGLPDVFTRVSSFHSWISSFTA